MSKSKSKASKKSGKSSAKKIVKIAALYAGAPIPATRVFVRTMPEFKNTRAECWLLWNEVAGTVCFCNTYGGLLKASYNPEHYTFSYKAKVHDSKMEAMKEIDVTDFPQWITNAHARRRAVKAK